MGFEALFEDICRILQMFYFAARRGRFAGSLSNEY